MICYSIIIPAYNEEKRIERALFLVYGYLERLAGQHEIIVVANGCTDNTCGIVRRWISRGSSKIKLKLLETHQAGKGLAVRIGMREALGNLIYMCDTDLSTPIEELQRFADRMESTRADIVIGSREKDRSNVQTTRYRRFAGRVFHAATWLLVPGFTDTQCGFKLFTLHVAKELAYSAQVDGWAWDVEMLYLARRMKMKVSEIGVTWINDPDSRVRMVRDIPRMLCDLLRIPFLHIERNQKIADKVIS